MGAPLGNTNSNKNNRMWGDTIRKAVIQADGGKLMEIANKLIELAAQGDLQAMKEIGDRLDGKPPQTIQGDAENPVAVTFGWMNHK